MLLTLVNAGLFLSVTLDVFAEPFAELFVRVKHARHDEVQQRPQLQQTHGTNVQVTTHIHVNTSIHKNTIELVLLQLV